MKKDDAYEKYLKERAEAKKALMLGRATSRQFAITQVSYEEWYGMQSKEVKV